MGSRKTGKRPTERNIGIHHVLRRRREREMIVMVALGVPTRVSVEERSNIGITTTDTTTDMTTDTTTDTTIDTTIDTMINERPIPMMSGPVTQEERVRDTKGRIYWIGG